MNTRFSFALLAVATLPSAAAFAQNAPPTSADAASTRSAETALPPGAYRIPGTAPVAPLASDAPPAPIQTDVSPAQPLPPPIRDDRAYSMTLFDLLEYRPKGADSDVRWDIQRWSGGDYRRFFIKTEGELGTRSNDYDADLQLLTSRLTKPFTELQYGLRLQARKFRGANVARPQAVLGVETRVPYNYEIESALYLDPKGRLSGDFKATKDVLLSQRLILHGRFEANAAVQQAERFGFGSGLNDIELGLRLRYEIRREFAPYIGVSYGKSYGRTATFIRQDGGDAAQTRFVLGVRAWF